MQVRACLNREEMPAALAPIWHYFGQNPPSDDGIKHFKRVLPLERVYAGFDADKIVAGTGAFDFDFTIPGGQVRAPGVTVTPAGLVTSHWAACAAVSTPSATGTGALASRKLLVAPFSILIGTMNPCTATFFPVNARIGAGIWSLGFEVSTFGASGAGLIAGAATCGAGAGVAGFGATGALAT